MTPNILIQEIRELLNIVERRLQRMENTAADEVNRRKDREETRSYKEPKDTKFLDNEYRSFVREHGKEELVQRIKRHPDYENKKSLQWAARDLEAHKFNKGKKRQRVLRAFAEVVANGASQD